MKRWVVWVCLLVAVVFFSGCQGSVEQDTANIAAASADKTDAGFPAFLVGSWKAKEERWRFTFEPDGTISSLEHNHITVPVKVEEGGVYEPLRKDCYGMYFLGPCDLTYDPNSRELSVTIVIDDFYIELPNERWEGKMRDYFVGPVSDDGITWRAKWRSRIEMPTIGPADPNPKDKEIIFQKIDQTAK